MNRCLICFGVIEETLNNNAVCNKCLSKFNIIETTVYYKGIEIFILYDYNDFFKGILYRYKACYDKALKDAFLTNYLMKLRRKYKTRKVICAPSSEEDDKRRGFNHVKLVFEALKLEQIDCLKKTNQYKQSNQRYEDRKNIQKNIKIDKTMINNKDKLLIVDDVATSLSTIKAIIHLLPTKSDIKVLILASNCRFMENEKN